jgi:hypothetical protein
MPNHCAKYARIESNFLTTLRISLPFGRLMVSFGFLSGSDLQLPYMVASGGADIVGLYLDKPQAPRQRKLMVKLPTHKKHRSVLLELLAPV